MASLWGITPRQSVLAECGRRGQAAVIAGCVEVLEGRDVDDGLLVALAGPHADYVISGHEGGRHGHWPPVWAARGLLYVWDDSAAPAVIAATGRDAWRLREMAAKVIARQQIGDGLDAVLGLRDDPVPRVRAAAHRAVEMLVAAGA